MSIPADLALCPFCKAPTEPLAFDEALRQWKSDMAAFERYRRLFPARATADETQSVAAHAAAAARDRKRFGVAVSEERLRPSAGVP